MKYFFSLTWQHWSSGMERKLVNAEYFPAILVHSCVKVNPFFHIIPLIDLDYVVWQIEVMGTLHTNLWEKLKINLILILIFAINHLSRKSKVHRVGVNWGVCMRVNNRISHNNPWLDGRTKGQGWLQGKYAQLQQLQVETAAEVAASNGKVIFSQASSAPILSHMIMLSVPNSSDSVRCTIEWRMPALSVIRKDIFG